MSHYHSLWKQPQKLIFDLGNLVDQTYNGTFKTTLTARFFKANTTQPPADLILPISKKLSAQDQPSAFRVPDEGPAISTFSIPRNVKKAVFTISACGQADEEFWWSAVPQSVAQTFVNNTLPGYSPWRELQLWVDGSLTGVTWPFPIIFTGGVVPNFWRPVVGIDAFDLKEDEIDVTPWLPALSDGKDRKYEIRVVGLDTDATGKISTSRVGSNWVVTGKLFLWLDAPSLITKGDLPKVVLPEPQFVIEQTVAKGSNGRNDSLTYKVLATRELTVEGSITTSEGTKPAGWKQTLKFSNIGNLTAGGFNQSNIQHTSGTEIAGYGYSRIFNYPLNCASQTKFDKNTKEMFLSGQFNRGKLVEEFGDPVFPTGLDDFDSKGEPLALGYKLNTTQVGEATYHSIPAKNSSEGMGITEQVLTFDRDFGTMAKFPALAVSERSEALYSRHILAKNGRIDRDEEIQLAEIDPTEEPPIKVVVPTRNVDEITLEDLKRAGGKRIRQLIGTQSRGPSRLLRPRGNTLRRVKIGL
jgi:Peptide N-acetyl-beta-D-glucosaminyl asparaginase amidase A